jgi:glutathione S-transferase
MHATEPESTMTDASPLLVIGNKRYSSWSLRPWLLLAHHGVAFDEVVLPLDTPEFSERIGALSPSRRVPALRHGELDLWDSLAIVEYANETWLDGAGWPADRLQRARARACAAEMHSGFTALRGECPMNVCRMLPAPLPLSAAAEADVARVVALWRDALNRSGGPFLFGGFGIIDAFFAPVTTRLTTYAIPIPADARAYIEAVQSLPAFRRWVDDAAREPWRIDKYERIGLT